MTKEADIRKIFDRICESLPGTKYGVCKLNFSIYQEQGYNYAVIFYFPLPKFLTLDDPEEEMAELQTIIFPNAGKLRGIFEKETKAAGIKAYSPPIHADHQTPPYMISLSVKQIGVNAGIGWIGKNDLLITYEYGARITTLGAVFYADDFTVKEPVTKSECGDCRVCVDACPYKNIYGNNWEEGVSRDELVDYHKCSMVRYLGGMRKYGRKISCARCQLGCPVGEENVRAIIESQKG